MKRYLPLMVVVFSGCLSPREDTSAFFLLSPTQTSSQDPATPVTLGVGPITIPGYLDRPQIVVRMNANEVALSATDRWAEPLGDHLARTLTANLTKLLPGSRYVEYPWYESAAPDLVISVVFRSFESTGDGNAILDATWQVSAEGEAIAGRAVVINVRGDGVGRAAAVAAQSRALARLADEIAGGVRGSRDRAP